MNPDERVYFAHRRISERGVCYLHASPNRKYVEAHGSSDDIVEVRVRERREEDPMLAAGAPDYHGWIEKPKTEEDCKLGYYHFIWPSKTQVSICFAYGVEVAERHGSGRLVRLVIEEV